MPSIALILNVHVSSKEKSLKRLKALLESTVKIDS